MLGIFNMEALGCSNLNTHSATLFLISQSIIASMLYYFLADPLLVELDTPLLF